MKDIKAIHFSICLEKEIGYLDFFPRNEEMEVILL